MGIAGETASSTTGTDPVRDAVGGERIKIAGKMSLSRTTTKEFSPFIGSGPAVAPASIGNSALIRTQIARSAGRITRRERGESEILPHARMDTIQMRLDLIKVTKNAFRA
jgi:hypothetical protein